MAVRHAIEVNSISGICLTKLDVLDGLEEVKLCVGYELPMGQWLIICRAVMILLERSRFTKPCQVGVIRFVADLAGRNASAAKEYVHRLGELVGAPIDIVSTGPDREQTIVISSPFGVD